MVNYLAAFIASGLSFPVMLFQERVWPNVYKMPSDTLPRITKPGRLFHDLKNLATEACRADPQYFSKMLSFIALGLGLVLTLVAPYAMLLSVAVACAMASLAIVKGVTKEQ